MIVGLWTIVGDFFQCVARAAYDSFEVLGRLGITAVQMDASQMVACLQGKMVVQADTFVVFGWQLADKGF